MDSPNKKFPLFAVMLAIFFGWGSLWVGYNGFKLATSGNIPVAKSTASVQDSIKKPIDTIKSQLKINNITLPYSSLDIMIGGDVMFDRNIRLMAQQKGYDYPLSNISQLLGKADIAVVNLEGPITSNPSKTLLANGKTSKDLIFTFSTTTARALANASIDVVSLANNHTDNFGLLGLKETKRWLTQNNVEYFGDPWNGTYDKSNSTSTVTTEVTKNGITIALVGYHSFQPGFDKVVSEVKKYSAKGDFVIVMPHWGEEYTFEPSEKMRGQAKTLVQAGAKAIIGSHPHVIMSNQYIGNVPVYYSLGNLLFDQYFRPEVMHGNIVEISLLKSSGKVSIDSLTVHDVKSEVDKAPTVK